MTTLATPVAAHLPVSRVRRRLSSAAVALATTASIVLVVPEAAQATPGLTVSPAVTAQVNANSATTLSGLVVSGDTSDQLQVTVATSAGTISIPTTTNLTLAYDNIWSGDASVTFTGLQFDIDAALATVQLVTTSGDAGHTASVSLTAMVSEPDYVYSAPNQHFYQYVAEQGITWTAAKAAAESLTFDGQQGYLATIPNDAVNDFVANKIQNAENVWIGAESIDTPDASPARTWQWTGGPLSGQPISYCTNFLGTCDFSDNAGLYSNWADVEPNNYEATAGVAHSGEYVAVTNWQGGVGEWNDLPPDWSGVSEIAGYVVEYGDQAVGSTGFAGVATTSSNVQIADATSTGPTTGPVSPSPPPPPAPPAPAPTAPSGVPSAPTHVRVHAGDRVLTIRFTPPVGNGGSSIVSYQVSIDGGRHWRSVGNGSTRTASVTGVLNGKTYRVRVRAVYGTGVGPATGIVRASTPSWFHDPIGAAARRQELRVPSHPADYHGALRWTTARDRTHDGAPAMPVGSLRGRQLQKGQAASLGTNALFAFDSANLSPAGVAAVRSLVRSLRYDDDVVCEGFADYGGEAAHEKSLSRQRARAVCAALTQFGAHVRTRTHGYGGKDPVIVGGRPADRAANRRVVVLVTG